MDELSLISLFYLVDDFCNDFEQLSKQALLTQDNKSKSSLPTRKPRIILSELMTIVIAFHSSGYRTFKDYYLYHVVIQWNKYFPNLVSYKRFVKLMSRIALPLFIFQRGFQKQSTGVAFIDSTLLSVCHIRRASSNRVFRGLAKKGKSTVGWFFGFKLHVIVDSQGEMVSWVLTQGNVHDIATVEALAKGLTGLLFGDRGYIGKRLFESLLEQGIKLVTRLRQNMKNVLMDTWEKNLLRKRGLIESVFNKLKTSCQIDHHRHRSPINFLVNLLSGLTAYCCDPNKPTISLSA